MSAKRITSKEIGNLLARAERWAIANPGQEYRKTVVDDEGGIALVSRWFYEEACSESEWIGEVFAIKEPGRAVYSSFDGGCHV